MIRPKHIRTRLALWYSGILGLILVAVAIGVSLFFVHGLRQEFDRSLTENFERAARHLEVLPSGDYGLRKPEKASTRDFAQEMPVEVWAQSGELLYRSPAWLRSDLAVPRTTQQRRIDRATSVASTKWWPLHASLYHSGRSILGEESSSGERFRLMEGEAAAGDRNVIIRVAASEERVWHEVKELAGIFLFIIPLALILSGFAGYFMANKALRPVEAMGKRACEISAENLGERLPVLNPDDELGGLAQVINGLLARLERSFEELKRFSSDASHELRTPLQALRSLGEVGLQSKQSPEHYREVIASMLEETDRMSRLTNSLLTISRADAGNFRLQKTSVSFPAMVEEIRALLGVLAEEKQQKLNIKIDSQATAHVDSVVFRQALVNLVDNAIKYSPARAEILVQVSSNHGHAVIEVKDQGIGISREHQEKIFDRFYRVDKSRSRDMGGVGLGLSIAKWAVESHGGRIELESSPSHGSLFRILVPVG